MNREDIREVDISYSNLEDIEIPEFVYKYRSWGKEIYSDNVLLKNELYLAEPDSFEDKFDCKIPTRYDLLTQEEITEWGISVIKKVHPKWNDEAILREVNFRAKDLPFGNEEKMIEFERREWEKYNERAGVLSLCKTSINEAMWKKYGDGGAGISYGFNTRELIKTAGFRSSGPVIYEDELPIISPFMDMILISTIRAFYKLREWDFEDEYRVREFNESLINRANRVKIYGNTALKEVVLGYNFNQKNIESIIQILIDKGRHAKLYLLTESDNKLLKQEIAY